ncbi:cupin domain protein [Nemania sp. FL0916]|nr:cupin domain protein [Nemania sp. FL0916]
MATEHSEPASTTPPDLANPTRVITTTNPENGISIFDKTHDESLPVVFSVAGSHFRLAYASGPVPEALDGTDITTYGEHLQNLPPLVRPDGGANVWYIDTPPGAGGPMHRTISLDFVTVLEGEVELNLDSGEKRTLKAGDTCIQRSTAHQWKNHSKDKWVRFLGVIVAAQPIALADGTTLGSMGLDG